MALYPGSLQTLALKRIQYTAWGGGGGVQTKGPTVGSRSKITQQAGEQTADFRVADRKEIESKKRLWVKKVGGGDRCADNR
jgi:hypothetical protein